MIRDWVTDRMPPVPLDFAAHLDAEDPVSVDGMIAASKRALGVAMHGADSRNEAFALLAADAYVTWACALTLSAGGGADQLEGLVVPLVEGLP